MILLLLYLLSQYAVEARRGVNRHQHSRSRQRISVHHVEHISNYPVFAEKLLNPCGPTQRVIVKRSTQIQGKNNFRTFLNIASDSSPTKQSVEIFYNLVTFIKNSLKLNEKDIFNERYRRETEERNEFLIKKLELRNLVSGLQILIHEHLLQVKSYQKFLKLTSKHHQLGNDSI